MQVSGRAVAVITENTSSSFNYTVCGLVMPRTSTPILLQILDSGNTFLTSHVTKTTGSSCYQSYNITIMLILFDTLRSADLQVFVIMVASSWLLHNAEGNYAQIALLMLWRNFSGGQLAAARTWDRKMVLLKESVTQHTLSALMARENCIITALASRAPKAKPEEMRASD